MVRLMSTDMEIEERGKRRREDQEKGANQKESSSNKKDGIGGKVYVQPPTEDDIVVANSLREACGKGEKKQKESENQERKENKTDPTPEIFQNQIQEMGTFVEMVLDDTERPHR